MFLPKRLLSSLSICLPLMFVSTASQASLVSTWTFDGASPLADSQGKFGNLELNGATIADGKLTVSGSGTNATGWARAGNYTGPTITSKTMVVWASLSGLSDQATAGSLMTIDRIYSDSFDGLVFSERQNNRWMNGSSGFSRTQDFTPGYAETNTDALFQLAFTYEDKGNGTVAISGYRDGQSIGSYIAGNATSWFANDTEMLFGIRHLVGASHTLGAIDAVISEARLYDTALSQQEISALKMSDVPEPATMAIFGLGLAVLGLARKRGRRTNG